MGLARSSLPVCKDGSVVALKTLVYYPFADFFENFHLRRLLVCNIVECKLIARWQRALPRVILIRRNAPSFIWGFNSSRLYRKMVKKFDDIWRIILTYNLSIELWLVLGALIIDALVCKIEIKIRRQGINLSLLWLTCLVALSEGSNSDDHLDLIELLAWFICKAFHHITC